MEQLLELLRELRPDLDFDRCGDLVDGGRLDSLDILTLVSEVEERFDVTVPTAEILPENFNSAGRLWAMIQRLSREG